MRLVVLGGVRYLLDCTQDYFYSILPQVKADIQNMLDIQPGEQKWFNRADRWKIQSIYGVTTVVITERPVEKPEEEKKKKELRKIPYPVLAIKLTVDQAVVEYTHDFCAPQTRPVPGGWIYIERDVDYFKLGRFDYTRLVHAGIDDGYTDIYTEYEYPAVAANIIFAHEFADRQIGDSFGHSTWIGPVIFTCGSYVPQLPTELPLLTDWESYEYYSDQIRGTAINSHDYTAVILGDTTIAAGHAVYNRPYTLTYARQYIIPDDLYVDMWPAEDIANCCKPNGTYELYVRSASTSSTIIGEYVYYAAGESADPAIGLIDSAFKSCLYHKYNYTGDSSTFEWQLIFYAGGQEFVVMTGLASDDNPDPDDVYCNDFKIFSFDGLPVVAFSVFKFADIDPYIILYGFYFAGNMYLISFDNDEGPGSGFKNRHDIFDSRADRGLEGYGEVWAFKIEETSEE